MMAATHAFTPARRPGEHQVRVLSVDFGRRNLSYCIAEVWVQIGRAHV